jgi:hypothetical protein
MLAGLISWCTLLTGQWIVVTNTAYHIPFSDLGRIFWVIMLMKKSQWLEYAKQIMPESPSIMGTSRMV